MQLTLVKYLTNFPTTPGSIRYITGQSLQVDVEGNPIPISISGIKLIQQDGKIAYELIATYNFIRPFSGASLEQFAATTIVEINGYTRLTHW